mmetsp:Transcript_30684/g.55870  ORF Transcript_30684/g.55870 Transcript_30684/m.55870 type:complete len:278 (-) Transcript_30684:2886-3719(-)
MGVGVHLYGTRYLSRTSASSLARRSSSSRRRFVSGASKSNAEESEAGVGVAALDVEGTGWWVSVGDFGLVVENASALPFPPPALSPSLLSLSLLFPSSSPFSSSSLSSSSLSSSSSSSSSSLASASAANGCLRHPIGAVAVPVSIETEASTTKTLFVMNISTSCAVTSSSRNLKDSSSAAFRRRASSACLRRTAATIAFEAAAAFASFFCFLIFFRFFFLKSWAFLSCFSASRFALASALIRRFSAFFQAILRSFLVMVFPSLSINAAAAEASEGAS